jgi:hypothetical protein
MTGSADYAFLPVTSAPACWGRFVFGFIMGQRKGCCLVLGCGHLIGDQRKALSYAALSDVRRLRWRVVAWTVTTFQNERGRQLRRPFMQTR